MLNREQIEEIDRQLVVKYSITYEEIRCEVLDHLACEIEEEMKIGHSYPEAFNAVFLAWHPKLKVGTWGIYKGIPNFIQRQLAQDFSQMDWKLKLLGMVVIFPIVLLLDYYKMSLTLFFLLLLIIALVGTKIVFQQVKEAENYLVAIFKRQVKLMFLVCLWSMLIWFGLDWLWSGETVPVVLGSFICYYFFSICYFLYQCHSIFKSKKRLTS